MLRVLPILTLILMLGIQIGSPVCLAVTHALADKTLIPQDSLPSSQKDSHEEQCWFSAAHLFNKGLLPAPAEVIQLFCILAIVPAVLFIGKLPSIHRLFAALPDRAPPSRAFLQIFRI